MKTILKAAILFTLISASRADQLKPVARELIITLRIEELPKKEEGKKQTKIRIFDINHLIKDSEQFRFHRGGRRSFTDSAEVLEGGESAEGKVKLLDPHTAVIDLKLNLSSNPDDPELTGAYLVTGVQYQVHSKLKLGAPVRFMVTKPGEGRPRWMEIIVRQSEP